MARLSSCSRPRPSLPPRPGRRLAWGLTLLAWSCSSPPPAEPQNGPPAAAAVRDGLAADIDEQSVTSSLFANWDPFPDPEGSPVTYEWAIGTAPGAIDVLGWTPVGGATSASTPPGTELPVDRRLYVSVRGRDIHGTYSRVASSDGVVLGTPRPSYPDRRIPPELATGEELPPHASRRIAIERHGITWTFAAPTVSGNFVNGDWWVIGPVDIIAISPHPRTRDGRDSNGSMVNPRPVTKRQGYDSAMFGSAASYGYDPALNAARELSPTRPLHLEPGSSLVSAESEPLAGSMPQLRTCAVLTCLEVIPPADAFRPPYCGADRRSRWRLGDVDTSRLANLQPVRGAPDLRELAQRFARPWLDHVPGWQGRYLHPTANMPDYGRDMADLVGRAALALQLEGDDATKRPLLIGLIQLGIDNYGIVRAGGRFHADGGSGSGRKFPVVLAGALLGDDELLRCAREQKLAFAEDVQTFYVEETEPGVINRGYGGYTAGDIGLAEWGQRHADDPRLDKKSWTADNYRRWCTANAWSGFVLATRIMGLTEAWGHDALFDYVDRYMQIEPKGRWTRAWSPFVERMWDRYRADY